MLLKLIVLDIRVFINATDCEITKLMGVPEVFDIGLGYAASKSAASARKTSCPVLVAIEQVTMLQKENEVLNEKSATLQCVISSVTKNDKFNHSTGPHTPS